MKNKLTKALYYICIAYLIILALIGTTMLGLLLEPDNTLLAYIINISATSSLAYCLIIYERR